MKTLLKPKIYIDSFHAYSSVCLNHCIITKAMKHIYNDQHVKVRKIKQGNLIVESRGLEDS